MSFDDMLADANDAFFDAFAEAEHIIIRPAGGLPRPIEAIIDRSPPEPLEPGKKGDAYALIIEVRNHPTDGIRPRDFDAETWRVDVPIVFGGPLVTRGFVKEKFNADGGTVRLKVK